MVKAHFDKISQSFDEGRTLSEKTLQLWLDLISEFSSSLSEPKLLDLGCGTGRFALPIARELKLEVVGADSSKNMLALAREKDHERLVSWEYQNAEILTYPNGRFDIVFMSQLLHNVDHPSLVVKECHRVLKDQGTVLIRYGAIEQLRSDVEHTFFAETLGIDEGRWPTVPMVETWLNDAGFNNITSQEVIQATYNTASAHLSAVASKCMSVLTLISNEDYERGRQKLVKYISNQPNDSWLLNTKLTWTVGYKGSS